MRQILTYIFIIAALAHKGIALAQCPSNRSQLEITASYGLITGNQFAENFNSAENTDSKTRTYSSGNPFLSVRYFLFNRLALGASVGNTSEKGQYPDRTNPAFIVSTYRQSYTMVAMELYYIYYFRKHLEIYTIAGFGPSFSTVETATYLSPNVPGPVTTASEDKIKAQYTPVGVRYGGRLGGFLELGMGYKGLINGGVSYKFGSPCWWKQ